jgi:hypothetical protein
MFDLPDIARRIGFPMYMKPFDGGGWRGVSRVNNEWELMNAYDHSGETVMHLQKGLDDFDVFVRALAIGPQVRIMKYDPLQPHHARYQVASGFLPDDKMREARITVKLINAFFRWEFNSCESILKDGVLSPIDFANACPDIAVNSLHYHFPWAIKALMLWSLFSLVSGRRMRINLDVDKYFEIGDSDRSYDEKLDAYEKLADAYFDTEAFEEFRAEHQERVDEVFAEYAASAEFDDMMRRVIRGTFPEHEHEMFFSHFRGILNQWLHDGARS